MKSEFKKAFDRLRDNALSQLRVADIKEVPKNSTVQVNCKEHGVNTNAFVADVGEGYVAFFCFKCLQANENLFPILLLGAKPTAYVKVVEQASEKRIEPIESNIDDGAQKWFEIEAIIPRFDALPQDFETVRFNDVGDDYELDSDKTRLRFFVFAKNANKAKDMLLSWLEPVADSSSVTIEYCLSKPNGFEP